jgi:hypothetical protein
MDGIGIAAAHLMAGWLERQLAPPAVGWLHAARAGAVAIASDRVLLLAVGQAARRVGKAELVLAPADLAATEALRPGWNPAGLGCDQAVRLVLLLSAPATGAEFVRRLDRLCAAADEGELVAWYRGLPLYPDPPRHAARAAEGLRSNMTSVFTAVAHGNPYPAEWLSEAAWNQMVLKALFIGVELAPIVGLDRRANPALARMLCDYADERRAAGRSVSPELWRCVASFADVVGERYQGSVQA